MGAHRGMGQGELVQSVMGEAVKFAYADPPYIGMANKYPEKREVDHQELIDSLCVEFPDGWALSCHSPSLKTILPMCPEDVRVMSWVKPWCSFKPGVSVAYAWEPVLVRGGRKRDRGIDTVRDWVSASCTLNRGMVGAKPDAFCFWLFSVLNIQQGDEFVDLFPGTGAVTKAFDVWMRQGVLFRR